MLAAASFLVFLAALRTRLDTSGRHAAWSGLVSGAGIVFAAMLTVSAIIRGAIPAAIRFNDDPVPGPDTLRFSTELQHGLFGQAAIPFALIAVAVSSILILRRGNLSRWIGWLGVGVTVVRLGLVTFLMGSFATPLILVWVVGTSAHLCRTRGASEQATSAGSDVARAEPHGIMPVA